MSMGKGAAVMLGVLVAGAALIVSAVAGAAAGPGLGRPATPEEVARWDLNVFPDGQGLPAGKGSVVAGEAVYRERCASCHGAEGGGSSAEELAGARHGLRDSAPDKTIGSYWPYATTLFDYVRRSMPLDAPASLDDDQVYGVTAYLLYLNGLLGKDGELSHDSLPRFAMPNREGFIPIDGSP